MFRFMTALSFLSLFAIASGASADDKPKGEKGKGKLDGEALFKKLDANSDGKLSKEEFAKFGENVKNKKGEAGKGKGKGKGPDAIFSRLDTNGDGFVSLDEFKKFREMIGKKKQDK